MLPVRDAQETLPDVESCWDAAAVAAAVAVAVAVAAAAAAAAAVLVAGACADGRDWGDRAGLKFFPLAQGPGLQPFPG